MSSGFPPGVLRPLCLSAAFYLAELSPATTCCCSCSFSLQAAYMLLSGTSVNHRVEAEQSQDITGKTRGHFLHKIWLAFTKIAVLCDVLMYIKSLFFETPGRGQSCFKNTLSHFNTLFSNDAGEHNPGSLNVSFKMHFSYENKQEKWSPVQSKVSVFNLFYGHTVILTKSNSLF